MTRVRLPPDPHTSCITTIVDSQGGDAALLQAVSSSLQKRASEGSLAALLDRAVETAESSSAKMTPPRRPGTSGAPDSQGAVSKAEEFTRAYTGGGVGAIENVDSIVLVYDLDRVETFFRLENHWLPLIERCYGGKVRGLLQTSVTDILIHLYLIIFDITGTRDRC